MRLVKCNKADINHCYFNIKHFWIIRLPGSPLYNDRKKLVESLYGRGIKERFDNADIYAIACDYGQAEYKVFVYEDIAIKHPDKDFAVKNTAGATLLIVLK